MRRLVNGIIAPQRRESPAMSVATEGIEIEDQMSHRGRRRCHGKEKRSLRDGASGLEQHIRFEGDGVGGNSRLMGLVIAC